MADKQINIVIKAIDQATSGIKKIGGEFSSFAEKNQKTFQGMAVAGGVAFGAISAFAVSTASSFAEMSSNIAGATGATGDTLKEFEHIARDIGTTVPQSFGDIGSALGDVNTRLDLVGDELKDVTKDFLNFSRVNKTDVATSIRGVSRLMGDRGIEASKTTNVLDKLTLMGQKTGVNIDSLSENVVNYGVQLRTLGYTMDESVAMLSKFEKEGVATSKVFSGLSIAMANLADKGVKDIPKAFQETIKAIKEAGNDAEATGLAMEMFGRRAGPDLAIAVREGRFELEDYMKIMEEADGTLIKAGISTLTRQERLSILKNSIQSSLGPIMDELIPKIEIIIDRMINWINENPKLIANIIKRGGVLAGLVAGLGTLGMIIPKVIVGVKSLIALFTFATGPIGLLIMAIAGISFGLYKLFTGFPTYDQQIASLNNQLKALTESYEAGAITLEEYEEGMKSIEGEMVALEEKSKTFRGHIRNDLAETIDSIKRTPETLGNFFNAIGSMFDMLANWLGQIFMKMGGFFDMLVEKGVGVFVSIGEFFYGLVQKSREYGEKIGFAIQTMIQTIFGIFQQGGAILSEARQLLRDGIGEITTKAYNWIVGVFERLVGAISGAVSRLKNLFTSAKNFLSGGGGGKDGDKALGGTIRSGRTYLVGERGPEMITPTTTSKVHPNIGGSGIAININMGGITVQNEADENRLAEKISNSLKREVQLFNFGIN